MKTKRAAKSSTPPSASLIDLSGLLLSLSLMLEPMQQYFNSQFKFLNHPTNWIKAEITKSTANKIIFVTSV
jgi:hypothetical protein